MEKKEVLLNDGERIVVRTIDNQVVEIVCSDGKLVINKQNKETPKYDPIKQQEEVRVGIYKKCNEWLASYVRFHDKLWKIAKSDEEREKNLLMSYRVDNLYRLGVDEKTGKKLGVDLRQDNLVNPIFSGPSLMISNGNDAVFKYLFARTLNHFLKAHFANIEVPEDYDGRTIINNKDGNNDDRVEARLYLFNLTTFGEDYLNIYREIASKHNKHESCNFLIERLKASITGERRDVSENIESSIYFTGSSESYVDEHYQK